MRNYNIQNNIQMHQTQWQQIKQGKPFAVGLILQITRHQKIIKPKNHRIKQEYLN